VSAEVAGPIAPQAGALTREAMRERLNAGALLVDVLPRVAYAESHIPGALNLPIAEIPTRARRLLPDLSREIIVYCGGYT
jgi:rhodanese-related sulfurtransferase